MPSAVTDPAATPPEPQTGNSHINEERLAVYFALSEVGALLSHAVEQQLRRDGDLTYVQFQILATLGDSGSGSLRMTDLADRIVYSRSGVTYQAGRLERRRLISRAPSTEDERSTVVSLTAEGRKLLGQVISGHTAVVQRMLFATLSDDDIAVLGAILGRVRDRMRQAPPRSAAPRKSRRAGEAGH
jgi:DNA-binding MarR family transcriptional regulator